LLWPEIKGIFLNGFSLTGIAADLLPWLACYVAYGYLLHLCFMHIQFGKAHQIRPLSSFIRMVRYSPIMIVLALVLLTITGILTVAAVAASQVWAGFLALLLFQLFPLLSMYFRVWSIASQYELWSAKSMT
jgi:hypothetical protein